MTNGKLIESIMIIDDDPNFAKKLCELLAEQDYLDYDVENVSIVPTLKEYFNNVESVKPDIIILDLELEDSQGIETLANVVAYSGHECPIIVLSSIENHEIYQKCVKYGAELAIPKSEVDNEASLLRYVIYQTAQRYTPISDFLEKYKDVG